ncbi:hypothetical protein A3731_40680 [Roseovarius sp. HI0049]|nr:hypothetical protein A3731_18985 [Roseovarius sp. HI0049]KZY38205.1 hypothetical protein A3731_40680 [Roseovarius sp. HI0049]
MYPPFTPDQEHHLPHVLSAPRFATYLRAAGHNRTRALELYHWNLQASAAFLIPLHVFEVVLRNAIVEAVEARHGGAWPWTEGFVRSLPDPRAPAYSPKRDLLNCARRLPTAGKIVAELRFVFWERMLTSRHRGRLWDSQFFHVFPCAPRGVAANQRREELRADVEEIRKLRNRIAHHEPIFARGLQEDLERVLRCIEWRNHSAASWVGDIETVGSLLAIRPW